MSTPKKSPAPKEINFNALLSAVKEHLIEKKGIRPTATTHGIDKSSLQRHAKKVADHFGDISKVRDDELLDFLRTSNMHLPSNMVFSLEQERDLVQYILKCVNHYYGLSINELRELALQLAIKLQVDYPSNWNDEGKAGRQWYRGFMARHRELTLRTPEQTSINRVKAFCKPNVDKFFVNLGRLIDERHFDGTSVYNMDESGFSTVPSKIGKVIALKGMRRVGQIAAAERGTMVTMALTVSANGNSIPPFFLFPRKKMQSYFLDNAFSGTVGFANESGWMCQPEFVRFMRHFIRHVRPSKESPVLLLMDNHCSLLSVDALDLAVENGVHILSFPPHCSHKLQPLDVSVFGPLKSYYKSQCSAWQKNNANKVLEIRHIAGLACAALDLALTQKTIKSGFAATGIQPFNPDIFTDADFVQAVEPNKLESAIESQLKDEDQRRIVSDEIYGGNEVEVLTSPSSSMSGSVLSLLNEIGPLQGATPNKPSKRGRKTMESSELTSPECIANLKKKKADAENRPSKSAAKPSKSAAKPSTSAAKPSKSAAKPSTSAAAKKKCKNTTSTSEDLDFCIVCLRLLPKELNDKNSIECERCKRPVHKKCPKLDVNGSVFICKRCLQEEEDDDD